jgi:hypothetical protein
LNVCEWSAMVVRDLSQAPFPTYSDWKELRKRLFMKVHFLAEIRFQYLWSRKQKQSASDSAKLHPVFSRMCSRLSLSAASIWTQTALCSTYCQPQLYMETSVLLCILQFLLSNLIQIMLKHSWIWSLSHVSYDYFIEGEFYLRTNLVESTLRWYVGQFTDSSARVA